MKDQQLVERRATGAFRESTPRSGRREAVLIEAGWGSSGYYPEEVLGEFGPTAWPIDTHMHLDHPSLREDIDRPEGSVKDLIGVVATTPRMAGIQLVSEAKVFKHWQPVVDELAPHIGISVIAPGVFEHGDAGGKHGPIVKEIHHSEINRVDLVTVAGAGGKLGTLIESAQAAADGATYDDIEEMLKEADDNKLSVLISRATDLRESRKSEPSGNSPDSKKEKTMENEELQRKLSEAESTIRQKDEELKESGTKLQEAESARDEEKSRADRAEDALLISGARTIAREAVVNIEGLPERAIDRIVESATRGELPKDESGKLIKEKVKESALQKAREELEYLAGEKIEGDLQMRESGNGSSSSTTTTTTTSNGGGEADEAKLVEAFQSAGMSEDAAKIAAKGR